MSQPSTAALNLLDFLLRTQTRDGHLSVTPAGGRGRGDAGPGFDQQPIEVSAPQPMPAERLPGPASRPG